MLFLIKEKFLSLAIAVSRELARVAKSGKRAGLKWLILGYPVG